MPFTDHSDLFASIHEDGINRVVRHIQHQRPSLFNYATAAFAEQPDLFCARIVAAPEVRESNDPLFTVQDPLPILGAPVPLGLNFCIQFTELRLDFHPGNVIDLPDEVAPLGEQRVAFHGRVCAGLDCPPEKLIQQILPAVELLATAEDKPRDPKAAKGSTAPAKPRGTFVLPTEKLICFCLDVFTVAHFEWGTIGTDDQQWLKVRLDELEIVDLQPTPMENMIECYARNVLRLGLLPQLSTPIEKMVLDITKMLEKTIKLNKRVSLQPAAVPADVPHNPAIAKDQITAFVNLVIEEEA